MLQGKESFRVEFEELARDRYILGSPEDVIEQLERRVDRLDCNLFVFRVGWPGIENYKQLKVIELMGEHVLPYFHKKYGRGQGSRFGALASNVRSRLAALAMTTMVREPHYCLAA